MSEREARLRDAARVGHDLLEQVLMLAGKLPARVDRAPLRAALDAAFHAVAQVLEADLDRGDQLEPLDAALERVAALRAALEPAGQVRAAVRARRALDAADRALRRAREDIAAHLVASQDRLLRALPQRDAPALHGFQASTAGLPALHALDPPRLTSAIELVPRRGTNLEEEDEEDDADAGAEEDADAGAEADAGAGAGAEADADAEAGAGADADAGADAGAGADADADAVRERVRLWRDRDGSRTDDEREREAIRRLARDCMEDIGIVASLRAPDPGEPWIVAERFEQRLLRDLDALASLGRSGPGRDHDPGVLDALCRWANEPRVPDRGRVFARAFVLGCTRGEEATRAAVLTLREADRSTYGAAEEALSLAASPLISAAMERLLEDADPAMLRLALRVLRFRRAARLGPIAPLLHHPDPRVVEAAARCLGAVPERGPAALALERALGACFDDRACLAAAESLLVLQSRHGPAYLRDRLAEETARPGLASDDFVAGAARLLALEGAEANAASIEAAAQRAPRCLPYLGWLGHPRVAEPLIAALERAGLESHAPARLARAAVIAKALLRLLGPPDVLGGASGEAPEAEAAGPPPALLDPSVWRAPAAQAQRRWPRGQRHRFGKPFTPLLCLEELENEASAPGDRADAALELAIATGGPGALETSDWVARQRAELARIRQRLVESRSG